MRITPRKNAGVARRYYSQERLVIGEALEVWGNLDVPFGRPFGWKDANSLFKGLHPDTGLFLGRKKMDPKKRRSGWDFTFVAPKSVSILWGLSEDSRKELIASAHKKAVLVALDVLSRKAIFLRIPSKPQGYHGGFLFNHGMTRWQDPHLHTHGFLFNFGYDEEEEEWHSIDVDARWSYVARDIYMVSLAWDMTMLGYPIRKTRRYFDALATKEMKPLFSSAHEAYLSMSKGTYKEWQEIRKEKDLSKSFERLRVTWRSRIVSNGFSLDDLLPVGTRKPPGNLSDETAILEARASKHLAHVWQHVARMGLGVTTPEEVEKVAESISERVLSNERTREKTK